MDKQKSVEKGFIDNSLRYLFNMPTWKILPWLGWTIITFVFSVFAVWMLLSSFDNALFEKYEQTSTFLSYAIGGPISILSAFIAIILAISALKISSRQETYELDAIIKSEFEQAQAIFTSISRELSLLDAQVLSVFADVYKYYQGILQCEVEDKGQSEEEKMKRSIEKYFNQQNNKESFDGQFNGAVTELKRTLNNLSKLFSQVSGSTSLAYCWMYSIDMMSYKQYCWSPDDDISDEEIMFSPFSSGNQEMKILESPADLSVFFYMASMRLTADKLRHNCIYHDDIVHWGFPTNPIFSQLLGLINKDSSDFLRENNNNELFQDEVNVQEYRNRVQNESGDLLADICISIPTTHNIKFAMKERLKNSYDDGVYQHICSKIDTYADVADPVNSLNLRFFQIMPEKYWFDKVNNQHVDYPDKRTTTLKFKYPSDVSKKRDVSGFKYIDINYRDLWSYRSKRIDDEKAWMENEVKLFKKKEEDDENFIDNQLNTTK